VIMKRLMTSVTVERGEDGTTVRLVRDLASG
jgi:hypothetical protein